MKKVLYEYLTRRTNTPSTRFSPSMPESEEFNYPIITISREFGCVAKDIAADLVGILTARYPAPADHQWITINKEVLIDVAKELKLDPAFLRLVETGNERNIFGLVTRSFAKEYNIVDSRMRTILREVISSYAHRGNVVVVGRGGSIFARNHKKALHVKLKAPFEWRVEKMMHKHNLSNADALKMVKEMDKKRRSFLSYLEEKSYNEDSFDLILNRSTMTRPMIVQTIITALESKVMNKSFV